MPNPSHHAISAALAEVPPTYLVKRLAEDRWEVAGKDAALEDAIVLCDRENERRGREWDLLDHDACRDGLLRLNVGESLDVDPHRDPDQAAAAPKYSLGSRVWWTDPDGDIASGPGTVTRIREDGESGCVLMDDAGEADAFLDELRPLTSEEQTRYTPSPEAAVFLANRKA